MLIHITHMIIPKNNLNFESYCTPPENNATDGLVVVVAVVLMNPAVASCV